MISIDGKHNVLRIWVYSRVLIIMIMIMIITIITIIIIIIIINIFITRYRVTVGNQGKMHILKGQSGKISIKIRFLGNNYEGCRAYRTNGGVSITIVTIGFNTSIDPNTLKLAFVRPTYHYNNYKRP